MPSDLASRGGWQVDDHLHGLALIEEARDAALKTGMQEGVPESSIVSPSTSNDGMRLGRGAAPLSRRSLDRYERQLASLPLTWARDRRFVRGRVCTRPASA